MDLHAWITQQVDLTERLIEEGEWPTSQERGVRLRCEADRRILARHRLDPRVANTPSAAACDGCGHEWVQDYCEPFTENLNDCPELLDLAHAHGITPDILASLDRPQPPEPDGGLPADFGYEMRITQYPTRPIATADVPAALRGPNWKP